MAEDDRKVFVGGLRPETTQEAVAQYYSQFGEVEEVKIILDRQTGRSKGYGFITFRTPEAARAGVSSREPIIDGKQTNCNLASEGKNGLGSSGKRKAADNPSDSYAPSKIPKFDQTQNYSVPTSYPVGLMSPLTQPYMSYPYAPTFTGPTPPTPTSLPQSPPTQPSLQDVMNMLVSLRAEHQQLRAEVQQLRAEIAPLVSGASQNISQTL